VQAAKGLAEQARVMCLKAEVALRRGGALQLQIGLDSLLALKSAHAWTSSSALDMWVAFDGGWGRMVGDHADGEEPVWACVRKLLQSILREIALSHSAQRNTQQVTFVHLCAICVHGSSFTCALVAISSMSMLTKPSNHVFANDGLALMCIVCCRLHFAECVD
jgi:hypothetical protein